MKLTTKILFTMLLLLIAWLFASNMLLKKEYDKTDKSAFTGRMEKYWNNLLNILILKEATLQT